MGHLHPSEEERGEPPWPGPDPLLPFLPSPAPLVTPGQTFAIRLQNPFKMSSAKITCTPLVPGPNCPVPLQLQTHKTRTASFLLFHTVLCTLPAQAEQKLLDLLTPVWQHH